MQLEVYQTDAEAYEAAATLAAERLLAAARAGVPTLAVPGGRGGRAFMLALAGRGEVPWSRLEVFFADESCVPPGDPRSTLHTARESLLVPRGVAADRIHAVAVDGGDPGAAAAAYAALLARRAGTPPALDVVVLDLGSGGEVAAVAPGGAAARCPEAVAAVIPAEAPGEPRVARVTLTPAAFRAARLAIVTATGTGRAAALTAALREAVDPAARPVQAVLPSPTAAWFVDRAAAAHLLRDARPAAGDQ